MTHALICLNNATYGGVYYCSDFTTTGAITWTKLTTTGLPSLECTHFRVDYGDPINRQYVLVDGSIYGRNGGDWTELTPLLAAPITWLYTDPTTPGSIYGIMAVEDEEASPPNNYEIIVLISTDYGASWGFSSVTEGNATQSYSKCVEAIGDTIWCSYGKLILPFQNGGVSIDGGSTWGRWTTASGGVGGASIRVNPGNPNKAIFYGDGSHREYTLPGLTTRNVPMGATDFHCDRLWFDPRTPGRSIYVGAYSLKYTSDNWYSYSSTAISEPYPAGVVGPDNEDRDELLFGAHQVVSKAVAYLTNETDGTADDRAGANTGTPPYTDSVPAVQGLSEYGVWWGSPPIETSGVMVYADEQGDITDIPDYDGLGDPMFGDRASWRDRNVDGFDIYHAEDVERDEREIHAPQPTGNDGYGIIETGGFWVSSGEPIALDSDLHDAVTLDADAEIVLDLVGQEIGFDVQNANFVFAGPTSGAANEPTFRALVAADLPSSGHEHIINEDHTAECDGVEDTFSTSVDFREDTTAVYLNGLRQRLGVHYTEAATLDSITFVTPPEVDDELIIDYICTSSDYLEWVNYLLDSEGILLTDSDGEILTDSEA